MSQHELTEVAKLLSLAEEVLLGKGRQIRLALACLLAGGHLLIEDRPGVGKTTLALTLARLLGLGFQRIQLTSDLLPADLLGVAVLSRESGQFSWHPGPIFSPVVLADEINRGMPKVQSALLEAMEEGQVSVEGETRPLPTPFFVIATQNPLEHAGTFPLPDSQLDRFLMCIDLGLPDAKAERALLEGESRRQLLQRLRPFLDAPRLVALQAAAAKTHVAGSLLDYIQSLLAFSRTSADFREGGLSPRAGLGLLAAARAWAFIGERAHVLPEDVQAVLPSVVGHRLRLHARSGRDAGEHLLISVPVS
ncbi:MAG: MoxR family ATPase [Magnetococcales bacterium]|nr:MoxR family ATPase [Magnetococcales bacterium]